MGLLNVSTLLNHLQSLPRSKSTVGHQFKPDEMSYIQMWVVERGFLCQRERGNDYEEEEVIIGLLEAWILGMF